MRQYSYNQFSDVPELYQEIMESVRVCMSDPEDREVMWGDLLNGWQPALDMFTVESQIS